MRAAVFFVQLILWLLIIRLVLRGITGLFSRRPQPSRATGPAQPPRLVEDLVLDRMCHSHFPRSAGISARVAGREELFCSTACRDKALAEVARAS
jgi:hypothetical protein